MYRALAIGIAAIFSVAIVLVSWRFTAPCRWLLGILRRKLLAPDRPVALESDPGRGSRFELWLRAWAVLAVAILATLTIASDFSAPNAARALGRAVLCAAGALTAALFLVFAANALLAYLPHARAMAAVERHGIRSLWIVPPDGCPPGLVEILGTQAKASKVVRILDLTGFEFIGRGPGLAGGLLHDVLATMTGTPVEVLLLDPDTRAPDPDHKQATVYQAVLGELELTPTSFRRKLRATVDAIDALNEKRAPEAKISVRFYREKPCFRGILFDDAAFVSACFPPESRRSYPLVELSRESDAPSLYESFRRAFVSLWRAYERCVRSADSIKPPSTVVRRRPAPEVLA